MSQVLSRARRIVIKVGSSLVTNEGRGLDADAIGNWCRQLAILASEGRELVMVSSGAIAEGMKRLGWSARPRQLHELQAAAAVGQMGLAQMYESMLRQHDVKSAQVLLTHADLADRERYLNARSTLITLLKLSVVPVINENDTVATDEIQFGDNDKLAALTAVLLNVDILIIATNTNGIYTKASIKDEFPKTIELVTDLELLQKEIGDSKSSHGTGGMQSKIDSAAIAKAANIETWIINGLEDNFILKALKNEISFTKII